MASSLSQSYFDETVVENEEVFDLSTEEAVVETIDQLYKQQTNNANSSSHAGSLERWKELQREHGISLTHPESKQGIQDREEQRVFQALLQEESWTVDVVNQILDILKRDSTRNDESASSALLLLGQLFWNTNTMVDNDDENQAPTGKSSAMNKMAQFANDNDQNDALAVALPVALQALSVGPPSLRRTRQDQTLHEFVVPVNGWGRLFQHEIISVTTSRILWLQLIHQVCQGNEPNKKYCNSKPMLQALVTTLDSSLQADNDKKDKDRPLTEATCQVLTVLCRFDDFSSQATKGQATDNTGMVVSSAHSTVTTLGGMGIVSILQAWLKQEEGNLAVSVKDGNANNPTLLLALLQCLRSLAIQDEMVVRMVSVGLLEVLQSVFQQFCSVHHDEQQQKNDHHESEKETMRMSILTALIGLYRNLSANDELKTTLCRSPQQSIVGPLIATLQSLTEPTTTTTTSTRTVSAGTKATLTKLQEHVCATLGSMALRQPQNAQKIVEEYQGHLVILKAMQQSQHSPLVQRQGCLAIRNLASRASDTTRQALLDAGAEPVLRQAATLGAVDEAYAALRDLGCHAVLLQSNPETGELERQPMFGEKPLQFRPVYD
ncbi:armadillo repeat containing 6 [Seminavis robusta]|uniref:Armadillo repeat containing 6 n=1 Tax=Seminavis robusta TaxID=568900 RepID=A0A9N8DZX1_9STRA|nr:armadillo repeat containing 6 [Seminavis robusta]|eukprot:Sro512_g157560.1 armadillo repeat containing 6 (607) ;mRNA; f:1989-3809